MLHARHICFVAVVAWGAMVSFGWGSPVAIPADCGKHHPVISNTEPIAADSAPSIRVTETASAEVSRDWVAAGGSEPAAMIPLPAPLATGLFGLGALATSGVIRKIRRLI